MTQQPVALSTSWVRVEGPSDARTCAWCARWVGRVMPVEMEAGYERSHRSHGGEQACRCRLEPARLELEAEDPGCAWA